MWLYGVTIFLGAFLLFQVQPLLAKAILPWFGGTPAVWTTCVLFFQSLLLAGYGYAFWLVRQPSPRRQQWIHLGLLAGCLAFLRILPGDQWRPEPNGQPVGQILLLLGIKVGLPFFALATTGPLLQAWFRGSFPARSPYRLYALSNSASLLALLSYPFLFEPWLPLRTQAWVWGGLFLVFGLACAGCARRARTAAAPAARPEQTAAAEAAPDWQRRLAWVIWPSCGSVLLLASTNQLAQDVSVVPFLWVLPLSVYLLTFILCFDSDRWYRRKLWFGFWPVAAAEVALALYWGVDLALRWQILAHTMGLFVGCMICHGELAQARPPAGRLTEFYLAIAAGGALGGVLVAIVAPAVLPDLWEYQAAWVAIGVLMVLSLLRQRQWWAAAFRAALVGVLVGMFLWLILRERPQQIAATRNFYGVLRVMAAKYAGEDWPSRRLLHGRITHGMQFTEGPYTNSPVSYYAADTGVGLAVRVLPASPRRIGVVGLGAGIMAAWGRTNDLIRFYEINPAVVDLSQRFFSYRQHSAARLELVLGDARLSLERETTDPSHQPLDLLVLDAFSSDSIPLHLLTEEAFALYRQRLRPGGILAVHISNRYLRLEPLVRGLAQASGQLAVLIENNAVSQPPTDASVWVLVTADPKLLMHPALAVRKSEHAGAEPPLVFTDERSNLFQLLK